MTFAEELDIAQNLPNKRGYSLVRSISQFAVLLECADNDVDRMKAYQTFGIALRIASEPDAALEAFKDAERYAPDAFHRMLIQRDVAMTYLDIATNIRTTSPEQAIEHFDRAFTKLNESRKVFSLKGEFIESAATTGFIARYHFLIGEHANGVLAFQNAHRVLSRSDNRVYELNNLLWFARASVRARYRYALRAFVLTAMQRNFRRTMEYIVLLVGGDRLYTVLKA